MDDTPFDNTLVAAFLQQLEPISLEYLEHHAGLLARFDRKYLVSLTLAAAMSSWKFGDQREFGYRSMYFDTPEHDAFHLAQTGRYRRFKVRTREYVEQGECFIEIKTPGKRGQSRKHEYHTPAAAATSSDQLALRSSTPPWRDPALVPD